MKGQVDEINALLNPLNVSGDKKENVRHQEVHDAITEVNYVQKRHKQKK